MNVVKSGYYIKKNQMSQIDAMRAWGILHW